MTSEMGVYQDQFAFTIAYYLGLNFPAENDIEEPIKFDH
tara:strand:- start:167 stop:283 length:117 start_codon:yes stop_codon:yes gene_type:complete